MKIDLVADNCVRLSQSYRAWRIGLLTLSGMAACLVVVAGSHAQTSWQAQIGVAFSVAAPLLLALWLPDTVWVFDRVHRLATWHWSWLLWRSSGTLPFERVRQVVVSVCENGEGYAVDPLAYQAAIGLLGEEVGQPNLDQDPAARSVDDLVIDLLGVGKLS